MWRAISEALPPRLTASSKGFGIVLVAFDDLSRCCLLIPTNISRDTFERRHRVLNRTCQYCELT